MSLMCNHFVILSRVFVIVNKLRDLFDANDDERAFCRLCFVETNVRGCVKFTITIRKIEIEKH